MSERILVIAAHPDDEVLGVGATVARHADMGDQVFSLILAEGATSRGQEHSPDVEKLQRAAEQAARILGAAPPRFGKLPDQRLDSVDLIDVVQIIEKVATEIDPSVVYTHHGGDLNVDHQRAHAAACTAFRGLPGSRVKAIYTFETVSSSEWASPEQSKPFVPQHFVDVTSTLERKLKALEAYQSEMRPLPHPRSYEVINHLARVRGSAAGFVAAEAFGVIRSRWM